MAQILLGRNEAKRIDSVSLSDDTVNSRIAGIANDILSQHIAQIQDSPCRISLQFDETADIKSISQLVAYVRFVNGNAIVDESLFCQEMKERTTAKNVFDLVNAFLRENSIAWNEVGSVGTDGAPAMTGHRSGFVALMKQVVPHIVSNHCAIHKYASACKILPLELKNVLGFCSKGCEFHLWQGREFPIIQSILRRPWKGASVPTFPHRSAMVIGGKVLSCVPELVTEVAVFLRQHGSVELATLFDDNRFQLKVFYLEDIFCLLNELSYSLQGKQISDRGRREGLRLQKEVITMEKEITLIDDHISNLEKKIEDYFPTSESSSAWIQQPFIAELDDNEQLNLHEQHLELQSSQAANTKFSSSSLI